MHRRMRIAIDLAHSILGRCISKVVAGRLVNVRKLVERLTTGGRGYHKRDRHLARVGIGAADHAAATDAGNCAVQARAQGKTCPAHMAQAEWEESSSLR